MGGQGYAKALNFALKGVEGTLKDINKDFIYWNIS